MTCPRGYIPYSYVNVNIAATSFHTGSLYAERCHQVVRVMPPRDQFIQAKCPFRVVESEDPLSPPGGLLERSEFFEKSKSYL